MQASCVGAGEIYYRNIIQARGSYKLWEKLVVRDCGHFHQCQFRDGVTEMQRFKI